MGEGAGRRVGAWSASAVDCLRESTGGASSHPERVAAFAGRAQKRVTGGLPCRARRVPVRASLVWLSFAANQRRAYSRAGARTGKAGLMGAANPDRRTKRVNSLATGVQRVGA